MTCPGFETLGAKNQSWTSTFCGETWMIDARTHNRRYFPCNRYTVWVGIACGRPFMRYTEYDDVGECTSHGRR